VRIGEFLIVYSKTKYMKYIVFYYLCGEKTFKGFHTKEEAEAFSKNKGENLIGVSELTTPIYY
jgi:hypothetical protein